MLLDHYGVPRWDSYESMFIFNAHPSYSINKHACFISTNSWPWASEARIKLVVTKHNFGKLTAESALLTINLTVVINVVSNY